MAWGKYLKNLIKGPEVATQYLLKIQTEKVHFAKLSNIKNFQVEEEIGAHEGGSGVKQSKLPTWTGRTTVRIHP